MMNSFKLPSDLHPHVMTSTKKYTHTYTHTHVRAHTQENSHTYTHTIIFKKKEMVE